MSGLGFVLPIIAILISMFSLGWNIISKLMNDRHIIHCYASLGRVFGGIQDEKVISISITNASKFTKFIHAPLLCIFAESKKNRKHLYINFNYGPINESSVELVPGKSTSFSVIVADQLMVHFNDIKEGNLMRFVVSHSLKHRYLSNPLRMQEVVDFYNKK
jgi:hypothetical protein